ncbi:hypothetical protein J6590_059540 [Homalodisca vitripennis]|nr:hypothetical protein J6590_059540 [Homalodisca vitripennis]
MFQFHQTLRTYLNDRVWDFYFYVSKEWPDQPVCLHFPGMTQTGEFIYIKCTHRLLLLNFIFLFEFPYQVGFANERCSGYNTDGLARFSGSLAYWLWLTEQIPRPSVLTRPQTHCQTMAPYSTSFWSFNESKFCGRTIQG